MKKIAHIDNSEFFRKQMKAFLEKAGHKVEGFEKGEDVLTAVGSDDIDIVIMGVEIMDMTGETLLQRLKEYYPSVPVIAVTSSDNEERKQQLTSLGISAIINKSENWQEELPKLIR